MFPELLHAAGYFTGVAGRTHHLDGARATEISRAVFERHHLGEINRRFDFVGKVSKAGDGPSFNDAVIEQMCDFLDAVPAGRAFFLQLCTSDPHRPFDSWGILAPRDPAKLKLPAWFPDTPEVRRELADYYNEVSRMDATFGRAMVELEGRGLAANTLVIFMGDNGASQLRGKGTLYEFGIHVPLLVRWPGAVKPGGVSDALVSGEDLAPTALEAAGLTPPDNWTGRSFSPLLHSGRGAPREFVFAERGAHGSELPGNSAGFDLGRAVVTQSHKLIYNALPELPFTPVDFQNEPSWASTRRAAEQGQVPASLGAYYTGQRRPMFELYDLDHDPDELVNLAGRPELASVEDELMDALQEWMILERDFLPLPVFERKPRRHQP
jgi:arylsulfatase A-like enzyme